MNGREALRAARREIAANKARSALSFAAISVGAAALLYTFAQTRGMRRSLAENLALMGPGRLTIERSQAYVSKGRSPGLTLDDADAIRREFPDLYMVAPRTVNWSARFGAERVSAQGMRVIGTGPEWRRRDWVYALRGRFINQWDMDHQSRVCVVVLPAGWHKKPWWANYWKRDTTYDAYALHHDLLGTQVRLEDSYFTVVGVLTPPPRDLDPRWESWSTPNVIVPLPAYQRRVQPSWMRASQIGEILIDTGDAATLGQRRREIERLLLQRHRGEPDFQIHDMQEAIEGELKKQRKNLRTALALGLVGLLAGGIGIMNVTLAAIFSRVKEIGVRRALGATPADILAQFVAEAALLGLAGGVAGVALGLVGVQYLKSVSERPSMVQLAWPQLVLVVAIGALVSAAFAAAPAWQASRLDPVEALKAE